MSQRTDVALALMWLISQSHTMRPDELAAAADHATRLAGGAGCRIHLISRDQRALVALPLGTPETGSPGTDQDTGHEADQDLVPVDGSVAGRAFRDTEILASLDRSRLWVPLLDGTERIGVLEVVLDTAAPAPEAFRAHIPSLAGLIAELVVSKNQYTDFFERAKRALPMGVAAEMLWRQLPPLTFASDRFVVTAQLEPWHEVGGDAFDYSIDGDLLHLAVFDAMGHGLGATLLAGVALASYRRPPGGDAFVPMALQVLTFRGAALTEIHGFVSPRSFPRFGLPDHLRP